MIRFQTAFPERKKYPPTSSATACSWSPWSQEFKRGSEQGGAVHQTNESKCLGSVWVWIWRDDCAAHGEGRVKPLTFQPRRTLIPAAAQTVLSVWAAAWPRLSPTDYAHHHLVPSPTGLFTPSSVNSAATPWQHGYTRSATWRSERAPLPPFFSFFLRLVSRQADWKIFLKSCPAAGGRSMPLKSRASQRLMLPQVFWNRRTMQSTAYSHHKTQV